jgi:hypothetical protein
MGLGELFDKSGGGMHVGVVTGDKDYVGPRGNISQGGGAFLRHPKNPVETRRKHLPGYLGHRPFSNVVPQEVGSRGAYPTWAHAPPPKSGSRHFEQAPLVKGDTNITPGYAGWVRGAQETFGQSPCLLPAPDRIWFDTRPTAMQYNNSRSYRAEVGGIVPGYRGHMPGSLRNVGSSNYGGVEPGARQHSLHGQANPPAQRPRSAPPQRPTAARDSIESAAFNIVERSGGVVPEWAARAAAKAAARGAAIRAAAASKVAAEARLAQMRLKTPERSQTVRTGVMPGYRGHVPRYHEEVGTSPYRTADSRYRGGRGAEKCAMTNTRMFAGGYVDTRPDDTRQYNKGSSFGPPRDVVQVL